jgi:hypothetical protein
MPNYRVSWLAPAVEVAPGTPAEDHFRVAFGPLSQDAPLTALFADFLGVTTPGDYQSSVQLIDVNGQPLGALALGPTVNIPAPVFIHPPQGVQVAVIG